MEWLCPRKTEFGNPSFVQVAKVVGIAGGEERYAVTNGGTVRESPGRTG